MTASILTQFQVRELFQYEPSTGWLIRRVSTNPRGPKGAISGSLDGKGYHHCQINKNIYRQHHLVWLYHFGFIPKMLDHRDRNRTNNRIENLRESSLSQNHANRSKGAGASRYKGVSRHTNGRWQAQTKVNKVAHHLGLYDTQEEARDVYEAFMIEIHGDYYAS